MAVKRAFGDDRNKIECSRQSNETKPDRRQIVDLPPINDRLQHAANRVGNKQEIRGGINPWETRTAPPK